MQVVTSSNLVASTISLLIEVFLCPKKTTQPSIIYTTKVFSINTLFLIKKWIGGLLMPLPFALALFLLGLIFLLFTNKKRIANGLLIFSFCFLTIMSLMPVSQNLGRSLEKTYPPLMQADIAQSFDYILVLGSGGIADPTLPPTGQLSATALSRFMEALRLFHANPDATLVVSGSGMGDLLSHAQLLENLAISVGVPEEQIKRLDNTMDTDDEARLMSQLILHKKAVLVTSATHMKRSMGLFRKYGTAPTPSPANYIAQSRSGDVPAHYYIPSAYYLNKSKKSWHEYLGAFQNFVKAIFK